MSNNTIRNSLYSRKKGSKGIFKSDTGITNFWKYYYQTKKPIPYSKAQLLIKDLFKGYLNILKESDHFYIPTLGYFGITIGEKSKRGGKHVDWIKTYELWKDQWPNLSAEEYTQIKEKPLVFFRNKIGIGRGTFDLRILHPERTSPQQVVASTISISKQGMDCVIESGIVLTLLYSFLISTTLC